MNITKVFRTDDGEIFDTKKEAQEYVAEEKRLSELTQHVFFKTCGIDEDVIRQVLIALSEDYEIIPK